MKCERCERGRMRNDNSESLGEFLYTMAKKGKWEAVVEKYEKVPEEAARLKLSRSGDTALHLAVLDNQEEIVQKLVKFIRKSEKYLDLLSITNERKNTCLHLAAATGSAGMCHVIASAGVKLVGMRNIDDETPLFLAAIYGYKHAFYCLYYFCSRPAKDLITRINTNCRCRKNGDTVLHCAIRNHHLDLAFHIINLNKEAVNWVNEEGLNPLQVLAATPTAFKSGFHGRWNILYYCILVDQLEPQSIETLNEAWKRMSKPKATPSSFPENYETCTRLFSWLWDVFLKVSHLKGLVDRVKNNASKKDKDLEKNVREQDTGFIKARDPSIQKLPENYTTCIDFVHFAFTAIMIILGFGSTGIRKIREMKQTHTWSVQVMEKLLEFTPPEKYFDDGNIPMHSKFRTAAEAKITHPYEIQEDGVFFSEYVTSRPNEDKRNNAQGTESAMLLAGKNGVIEMVKGLYERFPVAIRDTNGKDKKNVVLLAAEYRQPKIYRFLLKNKHELESVFRAVDVNGNTALHLAAAATDSKLWHITGAALQMQWEFKWYKFVRDSVPPQFFARFNKEGKTALIIFHDSHRDLIEKAMKWLSNTSKNCSVVAALIATVAFASAVTIPGGNSAQNGGRPVLIKEKCFFIFALSSLIALCLSSTSVIMFLAILTSRFQAKDFGSNLPYKLLFGLSSLYFSIIAMLISFCAAHFFLLTPSLRNVAVFLYVFTFLPVTLVFAVSHISLYFDLLHAILKAVPRRSADVIHRDRSAVGRET